MYTLSSAGTSFPFALLAFPPPLCCAVTRFEPQELSDKSCRFKKSHNKAAEEQQNFGYQMKERISFET